MSNYFCPKCNEPIMDIPWGKSNHTCTYIPYSIRNNITDKDLAGLLDYLEREMGGNIVEFSVDPETDDNWYHMDMIISFKNYGMRIIVEDEDIEIHIDTIWVNFYSYFEPIWEMKKELFFLTYKGILPSIRDLYSKK